MAQFFVMPQASPTMTVGVVAKWLVNEGDALAPSQAIAQVETDKATMDIEVFDKGVMLKRLAAEGQEVPPGQPIAIIGAKAGEDVAALVAEYAAMVASAAAAPPAAPVPAVPEAPPVPAPEPPVAVATPPLAAEPVAPGAATPRPTWAGKPLDDSVMEPRGTYRAPVRRVMASPLARARAAELGIDVSRLKGSGPGGRIVAADVTGGASATKPAARRADESVRATQMRKTIARRLAEVHQQVPVFYLTANFDATQIVALKEACARRDVKVSVNDLLIRCVAAALRDVPEVNAQWTGDAIVRKGSVDIGVAVALPEGLITPVIRDADQKGFAAIGAEVRALAGRAKEGKLAPEEYTGGTFTISNLGMFEIEQFTAILNPPEAAILAVGSAMEVPAVVNGQLVVQRRMKLTMTCDHRVIDGALGARFLQALRAYVENPGLLSIG